MRNANIHESYEYYKRALETGEHIVEIEMRVSDMDGYKDIAFFHHWAIEKR